jgi:hypothetical protein
MKAAVWAIALLAIVAVFAAIPDQQTKPAVQKTATEEQHDQNASTARYHCAEWTNRHSPLKANVSQFDTYLIDAKAPRIKVGIDYRAGADGLLMGSRCDYVEVGDHVSFVSAKLGRAH